MKNKFCVVYLIILLILVLFSYSYYKKQLLTVEHNVQEHALVAAEPLWNFDSTLMDEYLEIIMARRKYATIKVLESDGTIFSERDRSKKSLLEQGLQALHLSPGRSLTAPITKNGQQIGSLEVEWYDTSICGIAYGLLIAVLLLIIFRLYIRIFLSNSELGSQITSLNKAMGVIKKQNKYIEDVFHVVPLALITDEGGERYVEQNHFLATIVSKWSERTGLEPALIKEQIFTNLQQKLKNHTQGKLVVTVDDQPIHLEFFSAEVPSLDTIHSVIVLRDITDLVSMEQQISQTQKLEAVGQLAAGIAHEINTPTQYVLTNVDFLADTHKELAEFMAQLAPLFAQSDPGEKENIIKILKNAWEDLDWEYLAKELPDALSQSREGLRRIIKIVSAMKSFSRPASGQTELSDLNSNIENTATVAKNEWKYVADLELNLESNLPKIPCFPDELNQVFLNMIVNAAHAIEDQLKTSGEEKGKISISTRLLDDQVQITLTDTGKGMSEAICKKIFDPFFTTKEVGKGSGQGLAIARDVIVNKHHGTIETISEPGKGTTFVLQLPLNEKDAG